MHVRIIAHAMSKLVITFVIEMIGIKEIIVIIRDRYITTLIIIIEIP